MLPEVINSAYKLEVVLLVASITIDAIRRGNMLASPWAARQGNDSIVNRTATDQCGRRPAALKRKMTSLTIGAAPGLFPHYRNVLLSARDIEDPRLVIARDGTLEARYAPFDFINNEAQVVLMGITPGKQQANLALRRAKSVLRNGGNETEVLAAAKAEASFGGPMRENLIEVLDFLGVNLALGLKSCRSLWSSDLQKAQFTSALRYPVLSKGQNYTGSSPLITASAFLLKQLRTFCAVELRLLANARVLPLGAAAERACQVLINEGLLEQSRVIGGLPHPSPNNRQLLDFYLEKVSRNDVSPRVKSPAKVEEDRTRARLAVNRWISEKAVRAAQL